MTGISLCMIVRDEEDLLADCLASARPWVKEICVVDTGSKDGTARLAESMGARIAHLAWRDDFAAARNASLELAREDWILVLDADERLHAETTPRLREAILTEGPLAWTVDVESVDGNGAVRTAPIVRLFRNRPDIRFERAIHESVNASLEALGAGPPPRSGVRVQHKGYLPELVAARGKVARNARILRNCVASRPDDVYYRYKLACTLPASSAERAEAIAVAGALARQLAHEERNRLPFLPLVFDAHVRNLADEGRFTEAFETLEDGLSSSPQALELRFRRGEIARRAGRPKEARADLEACLEGRVPDSLYPSDPTLSTTKPAVALARLALEFESPRAAERAAARALEHAPDDPVARCLAVRSDFVHGRVARAEHVLEELLAGAPQESEVKLLAGELFEARGDDETARTLWRSCAPETEAGVRARTWLARQALLAGDPHRADEALRSIRPRDLDAAAWLLLVGAANGRRMPLDRGLDEERLRERIDFHRAELGMLAPGWEPAALRSLLGEPQPSTV